MTADVNVTNGASAEIEQKSGLDMSGHQDLPKAAVTAASSTGDCNDTNNGGNVTGSKDDSDGSYVFINGNDAVPDDVDVDNGIDTVASSDLNAKSQPLDEENGETDDVEIKADHGVGDTADSDVRDNDTSHSNNMLTLGGANGGQTASVEHEQNATVPVVESESQIPLFHNEVDIKENSLQGSPNTHESQPETAEIQSESYQSNGTKTNGAEEDTVDSVVLAEYTKESHTTNTDVSEIELNHSYETAKEKVEEETELGVSIDLNENRDFHIAGTEDKETKPAVPTALNENHVTQVAVTEEKETTDLNIDQDNETTEISNEVSDVGPHREQEQNLETAPSTGLDIKSEETEADDTSASDDHGHGLPDSNIVKEADIVNDSLVGEKKKTEQGISCETVSSSNAETDKNVPSATDTDTTVLSSESSFSVVQSEAELANGHLDSEKGEDFPAHHDNKSGLQFDTSEQYKSSDRGQGTALVERAESIPLITANETAVESDIEAGDSIIESEIEAGDSVIHSPTNKETIDDSRTEAEIEIVDNSSRDSVESHPVDPAELQLEAEKGSVVNGELSSCVADRELPKMKASSVSIESQEKGATFSNDDLETETKISGGQAECSGHISTSIENANRDGESIENKSSIPACSVDKVESEPNEDIPGAVESNNVSDSVVADERKINRTCDEEHVQVVSVNGSEQTCQEVEASTSSPEVSTVDASDGQNVGSEVGRRPFYYIIRIPRYDEENLKEQIKDAQLQVDAKTKSRDSIQTEVRTKRAICKKFGDDFEAAKSEEKSARDLLKAKRKEMDSLQSLINFEDIDARIRNSEHMIQHETLALKEEKQLIRDIKQLKQLREQLSSDMGSRDEEQKVVNQKDHVEERLKVLRKEAESLRENAMKAEAATKAAKMKYYDEKQRLNELQDQFDAAAVTRQKAYMHLLSLRGKLKEKNKYFWKYRDDATAAYDLAKKGDKEGLQRLCINQVEGVMELWNNSDEFRKEYIRCNVKSTLRRLRTLDGRSLGPDEEPPVISNVVMDRVAKDNAAPSVAIIEREKVALAETGKIDNGSIPKVEDKKNQNVKTKKPVKHSSPEKDLASVSVKDEIEEERKEEHKPTKEELELARKAKALRKEEEEAALKEQRRLEEKAKAREAMERKKRIAEKAQARAALRAQKEAEQKEKEKEKRARKKEKKAAAEDTNVANEGEAAPSSVPPAEIKESEMEEKPSTVTKRAQKPPQFTKQTKVKSIPPPLRNRGKRKMQTWMWVLLIALVCVALFYYW